MKKIIFTLFTIITIGTVSCQKESAIESEQTTQRVKGLEKFEVPSILVDARIGDIKIPNGTKTFVENNGATVRFEYPAGIRYFGKDSQGNILSTTAGSYTCTGNCTKGCDVFYAGGQFGCSACQPNTITCTGKAENNNLMMSDVDGGFINLNSKIRVLSSGEDLDKLQPAVSFLFQIPEVQKNMMAFNKEIYGVENPTVDWKDQKNYQSVVIDLAGVAVKYLMPRSYFNKKSNARVSMMTGNQIVCACKDSPSPGGCTHKTGALGAYESCVSGACISCNMTVNQQ
jgi:hypothetical protein